MWLELEVSKKAVSRKAKNFLFLIPKKIVKNAVDRNRIKRLIREAIRSDDFFHDDNNFYKFRVRTLPERLDLKKMQSEIHKLKVKTP